MYNRPGRYSEVDIAVENDASRRVPFEYDPNRKSYTRQCLSNYAYIGLLT